MARLIPLDEVMEKLPLAAIEPNKGRLSSLLGCASIWLRWRDAEATAAVAAIADAIQDVPWVIHDGSGDPPPNVPTYVQVKFRDGDTAFGVRWDWDQNWSWKAGDEHGGHIVAYRSLPTSSPWTNDPQSLPS